LDAVSRESQGRLDESRPGQPPVTLVQRGQARRNTRNATGRDSDLVVDELQTERHLELDELGMLAAAAEARNRHEAVEVSRGAGGRVVVDRVPAAEQAGHHGLGDAGREAGGDGGVRRGPALFERFDPGDDGRRVPSCDRREHRGRIVTIPAYSRHTRVAISSLRSQWGGGWWPPGRFGGQSVE